MSNEIGGVQVSLKVDEDPLTALTTQPPLEWTKGEYVISTDKSRLDVGCIHQFLSTSSYWAKGIPFQTVQRSIDNSLAFGLYKGERQIGFARVITDYATFAYVGDVFVLNEFRGEGLGKWLMEVVAADSRLVGLRRWLLITRDAHGLYNKTQFVPISNPKGSWKRTC